MTMQPSDNQTNQAPTSESLLNTLSWLGYGLLLLAVIDIGYLMVPPRFMDPNWEFQLFGNIIERSPVPILGFWLIFTGNVYKRSRTEKLMLAWTSWFAMAWGVLFLLLIPMGVSSTWRLSTQNQALLTQRLDQQQAQIQQTRTQLSQASETDLTRLVAQLNQKRSPNEQLNPDTFKQQALQDLKNAETTAKAEAQKVKSQQTKSLIKSAVKWLLGAIISATMFFYIWHSTKRLRRMASSKR